MSNTFTIILLCAFLLKNDVCLGMIKENHKPYWQMFVESIKDSFIDIFPFYASNNGLLIKEQSLNKKSKNLLEKLHRKNDVTLYQWWQSQSLIIPSSNFEFGKDNNLEAFNKFLTQHNIITGVSIFDDNYISIWTEKEQKEAYEVFERRAAGDQKAFNPYRKKIYINDLDRLLIYAKKVLKSYLPTDYNKINEKKFIKKGNPLGRIFTYNMIRKTIKENELLAIRLPRKFLIIYDKNNKEVVKNKTVAEEIINKKLKFSLIDGEEVRLSDNLSNYGMYVLAKRESDYKKAVDFNKKAESDLKVLVRKVPFDIGYDNIFTDSKGNAIIIDTEFKGENTESSVIKLNRYFQKK